MMPVLFQGKKEFGNSEIEKTNMDCQDCQDCPGPMPNALCSMLESTRHVWYGVNGLVWVLKYLNTLVVHVEFLLPWNILWNIQTNPYINITLEVFIYGSIPTYLVGTPL